MTTQISDTTTATRCYALTDGTGRQEKESIFARPWDLAAGLQTGAPVTQHFSLDERGVRALDADTNLRRILEFASWPLRVYEVEGVPIEDDRWASKQFAAATVIRQLETTEMFGPDGAHVAALLDRIVELKQAAGREDLLKAIATAWKQTHQEEELNSRPDSSAMPAEVKSASVIAYRTAYSALSVRTMNWYVRYAQRAARDAVEALAARHLIGTGDMTQERYDEMTSAVRSVLGPIHPADPDAESPATGLVPQFHQSAEIGGVTVRLVLTGGELTVALEDPAGAVRQVKVDDPART